MVKIPLTSVHLPNVVILANAATTIDIGRSRSAD